MKSDDDDGVIAFVRCDFVDRDLRVRFHPSWVRLLDGERVLTTHQTTAYVMHPELAEEVALDCNSDPAFRTKQWEVGDLRSEPMELVYSVVKYKLME